MPHRYDDSPAPPSVPRHDRLNRLTRRRRRQESSAATISSNRGPVDTSTSTTTRADARPRRLPNTASNDEQETLARALGSIQLSGPSQQPESTSVNARRESSSSESGIAESAHAQTRPATSRQLLRRFGRRAVGSALYRQAPSANELNPFGNFVMTVELHAKELANVVPEPPHKDIVNREVRQFVLANASYSRISINDRVSRLVSDVTKTTTYSFNVRAKDADAIPMGEDLEKQLNRNFEKEHW